MILCVIKNLQNKILLLWSYRFHNKEVPKLDSDCTCLVVITWFYSSKEWELLTASVFKWMQMHWKNVIRHITDVLENFSDNSDEE